MKTPRSHRNSSNDPRFSFRHRSTKQRNARLRLQHELLEPRQLLASDFGPVGVQALAASSHYSPTTESPQGYTPTSAPITWFETFSHVERVPLESLAKVNRLLPEGVIGPQELAAGEWIVQLTENAIADIDHIADLKALLQTDSSVATFELIKGLGSEGLILLRAEGASRADIEASLESIADIEHFGLNQLIQGQEVTPSDTDFVRDAMPSLNLIGMPEAWQESIGSLNTVVGVLDTGIDLAHRDLYLNIWLNQGEIPARFFGEDGTLLLTDIDGDGLITFYDLNHATRSVVAPFELTVAGFQNGPNKDSVKDLNLNGYVDALDILADPWWADGFDTDGNGEVDDFVGLNLRGEGFAPNNFAPNNPMDTQGHGTHVAGTIGAVGGNSSGVTGLNWQVSLMPLRILDSSNKGDTGSALRAVNYAKMMRERYRVNDAGRVLAGANVRVLNNSWGQPGGFETALETAITESGEAGILFVAASGNGNFLGQGVDNDRTPFYPASYNSPNIIAVAASTLDDRLAPFSNFGPTSVDLVAPGIGIRSTELGGGFGTRNGTSMATPHVAGTAALIWSALPAASVSEVTSAITTAANQSATLSNIVKIGGRLNAAAAINAEVFAPSARVVNAQNITTAGGTTAEFTVEYFHRSGFNQSAIEQSRLLITRQWGYGDQLTPRLKPGSVSVTGSTARASYIVNAPGGTWDKFDFGDYRIETIAGSVTAKDGAKINQQAIGSFNVKISPLSDPSVIYVSTFNDRIDEGSLRDAILAANRRGAESTIILNAGTYLIEIPPVIDPDASFPLITDGNQLVAPETTGSNATTGDFLVESNITVIGSRNLDTIIDAQEFDRVFRVSPDAKLTLRNLTLQNGVSSGVGGAILVFGDVETDLVIVRDSRAVVGSGIASLGGHTQIERTRITDNASQFAAIYIAGDASANVIRSTIDNNDGGGLQSLSRSDVTINTSTFSANRRGAGAVASGFAGVPGASSAPSLSADGRFVTFASEASNLVPGDINNQRDIFVYDRQEQRTERVSVNDAGEEANSFSSSPSLSSDGRFVTFMSFASNLVPGFNNDFDIFVFDRQERRIERVSINDKGEKGNGFSPSLSADGRFVTFESGASNLVPGDNNSTFDIFVYDRQEPRIERVSINGAGEEGKGFSDSPSLSADGRFVTFASDASNLVDEDKNSQRDIFVYDRQERRIERVSINDTREEANGSSFSPSLSADGRFVTFASDASNLVDEDKNSQRDIFVYDRQERRIERVSSNDAGEEANSVSFSPSISADGRFVTFESRADNLVPEDNNKSSDIFVYDRQERRIERVSINDAGEEAKLNESSSSPGSFSPSLSADGRFVTFQSDASNLVPGDTNNLEDIFVYDRQERRIERVSTFLPKVVVTSGTLIDNEATRTLFGPVEISNSLFAGNIVSAEADTSVETPSFNTRLNDVQRQLVGPLKSDTFLPPTHRLRFGNPAIDQGDPMLAGVADQNNTPRNVPDVGAVEASKGIIAGLTFADLNRNARRDIGEPIVKIGDIELTCDNRSETLMLSVNGSGTFQTLPLEPGEYRLMAEPLTSWTPTSLPIELIRGETAANNGDSFTPSLSADGRFVTFASDASNLVPDDNNGIRDIFVFDRDTRKVELISHAFDGSPSNGRSGNPSISADGRFVTFASDASNLVDEDKNSQRDIFVYDRQERRIERVSINDTREEANGSNFSPSLSADGRFVTFASDASNLVDEDKNSQRDIFVYDRQERRIERVSSNDAGEEANSGSDNPSLSADGRFVTFQSDAINLVPEDNNLRTDIFVYDRQERRIERVSVNDAGVEANSSSSAPSLSVDGRFVTFASEASNLVPWDISNSPDIFVYDRQERRIERVSVNDAGVEANSSSSAPSLSVDGRFVTFESRASNLVLGDNNNQVDIFVYDRQERRIERVSINDAGEEANNSGSFSPGSFSPSLSADGRFVTFTSDASNLVRGDANGLSDIVVVPNPFLPPSLSVTLRDGETIDHIEIPFTPNPGAIRGRVFLDTAVLNGAFDLGEEILVNHPIFLDTNGNGLLDSDEPRTFTDTEGRYHLENVPAFRNQVIVVAAPNGFEQIVPERENQLGFTAFLPAGGNLNGIDFGFRPIITTGQSSDSTIRGRVMIDSNLNGIIDEGDTPAANRVVYMDAGTLGVRDFNDPQAVTDANGFYEFTGLPATITPLRLLLDETLEQTSPVGSSFALQKFPLQEIEKREGNPQAVVTADFNDDDFLDVAVVLAETNSLSIRLNDGNGGFTARRIDLNLSELAGGNNRFLQPTAIVAGQFDADDRVDVALTGNFSSSVLILRNFDAVSGAFTNVQIVNVGSEPLDLVAGNFGGNPAIDLVVVIKGENQLQVLTNDGFGTFTFKARTGIATGGVLPSSIVTADFNGDELFDVAVTHTVTSLRDTTAGRVTILLGDGNGGLSLNPVTYTVQASSTDAAVGDFNGDDHPDLAVVNLRSNSISVLLGHGDGSMRVQTATLGTTQGAVDIAVADIDNDGDDDILASKLGIREVAIFRNIGADGNSNDVRFEPQESIGLGKFTFAERAPFALANLDNDMAGPNGNGTIDIIAVPQDTDTLFVLNNTLVQGSRRAAVSGARSNVASNVDFLLRAAILPPSFDAIANPLSIFEDAAQQSIAIDAIQKGQTTGPQLQFTATSSNPALIASPTITYSGGSQATLHYMPLADASGTTVITVRAVDAGADGRFGGEDDGIFERSFTVSVLGVNDPPAFIVPAELSRNQKAGAQSIANFVTGITRGGGNAESTQTLSGFTVTANASFFTEFPGINSTGTLTFTPNPDQSGAVPVVVSLTDNGGRTNGGSDSASKTFVINLLPVNDPPSVTIGNSQVVQVGDVLHRVDNFATNFLPGGGSDEASQTISSFVVRVDSPGLFSVLPDIDNSGRLTFAPAADRTGIATVNVQVRDTGGRANGGDDLSVPGTFNILVLPATGPKVLRPTQDGESIDLATRPAQELASLETVDLSGFVSNELRLSATRIKELFVNSTATVIAESNDRIVFDGKWVFDGIEVVDGTVFRTFSQEGALLRLSGPQTFTNPINPFDVDGNGTVAALDALKIINAIARKSVADATGSFLPLTAENASQFQFFDVSVDDKLAPLDALQVINAIGRSLRSGSAEGESASPVIESKPISHADDSFQASSSTHLGTMSSPLLPRFASSPATSPGIDFELVDDLMTTFGDDHEAKSDEDELELFTDSMQTDGWWR